MKTHEDALSQVFRAFECAPQTMLRSAAGKRNNWYPRDQFLAPAYPGVYFDPQAEKLLLFERDQIIVIQGGTPMAWRKSENAPTWRGCRVRPLRLFPLAPEAKIMSAMAREQAHAEKLCLRERVDLALWMFWQTFPAPVRDLVKAVHPDTAWGVLQCLCRIPSSMDQYLANPAAVILAYHHFDFAPHCRTAHPFRVTRRLLRGKQRTLLERAGFEPGDRRVLARLLPCDASVILLRALRRFLREDVRVTKALRHMRVPFGRDVVFMLREPCRYYVTAPLLDEVATTRRRGVATMLQDIHAMRMECGLQGYARFRSVAAMQHAHDMLVDRLNQSIGLRYCRELVFPSPPFPVAMVATAVGPLLIEPLFDPWLLTEHAREQKNCVACYCPQVADGDCFVYRATPNPNHAPIHTLAIQQKNTTGVWQLLEIEGPSHRSANPHVHHAVLNWLASVQVVVDQTDSG